MANKKLKTDISDSFKGRLFKSGGTAIMLVALALVVVIAVNLLVGLLPATFTKLDVTENDLYEIGDATKTFLDTLENDVTIYLVASAGQESSTLLEFLGRYNAYSPHISLKTIDPVVQPSFVASHTALTLSGNSVIVVSDKRSIAVDNSDIFVTETEYNYDTYEYEVTSIKFAGEQEVTSAIKYVTTDKMPLVALLSGHGEMTLSEKFLGYLSNENFSYITLNLLTDSLPDEVQCIVIASPLADISTAEVDALIEYLEGGGRLLVYTEYAETEFTNLWRVLEYYGLTMQSGVVFEGNRSYYYNEPYYLLPELAEHDILAPFTEHGYTVCVPYAHDVSESALHRDTITVTKLLNTSANAWAKRLTASTDSYARADGDPTGSFSVGACAEEMVGDVTAKVVWYGAASLLDDNIDANFSGTASDLMINSLAYLTEYNENITVHAKDITVETITPSEQQAAFLTVMLVGVIPFVFVAVGIFVWYKRRAQ